MSRAWQEIYDEWKSNHPNLSKDERRVAVRGCAGKIAYPEFWSALLAARAIQRDLGGRNNIYQCEICGANHIGRHRGQVKRKYFA